MTEIKKIDSFSSVETSNTENTISFIEYKKAKRVTFGKVDIVTIQKFKKYNKPYAKLFSQEGEEDDFRCQCLVF